jgi:hypothetical protein
METVEEDIFERKVGSLNVRKELSMFTRSLEASIRQVSIFFRSERVFVAVLIKKFGDHRRNGVACDVQRSIAIKAMRPAIRPSTPFRGE